MTKTCSSCLWIYSGKTGLFCEKKQVLRRPDANICEQYSGKFDCPKANKASLETPEQTEKRHKVEQSQLKRVMMLGSSGHSFESISDRVGVNENTVRTIWYSRYSPELRNKRDAALRLKKIRSLADRRRAVLEMRSSGLTFPEIARAMGFSVGTAHNIWSRFATDSNHEALNLALMSKPKKWNFVKSDEVVSAHEKSTPKSRKERARARRIKAERYILRSI